MVNLGYMYANGLGVEASSAESFRWNLRAAELGSAEGQVNAGRRYFAGSDVAQDYGQASQWFRKSAEQGNSLGQALLAGLYYVGHGVDKDDTLAYQWFVLAIANARSAEDRAGATEMFDLLLSELDASEVAAGSELVRQTLTTEQAAEAGDPQAQVELGYVRAAQGDDQAARRLFSAAAERGLVQAMVALGGWHMLQQTQAHHVQSLKWYLIAAKHGDEKAIDYAATLIGALPDDRVDEAKRAADQWRRSPADGRIKE